MSDPPQPALDRFVEAAMALLASAPFRVAFATGLVLIVVVGVRLNPGVPPPTRPALPDRPAEAAAPAPADRPDTSLSTSSSAGDY